MSKDYKIDDSPFFDMVDNSLANLDMEILIKAKNELIKNQQDTSIIDKAISKRKQQEINEKKKPKFGKIALLFGLLSTGNSKIDDTNEFNIMKWENDAIKSGGYEPHNFEEEELEEDDFYFEDDD